MNVDLILVLNILRAFNMVEEEIICTQTVQPFQFRQDSPDFA